jgi:8-oxo-dGTP pyrophosphatase MutT (NUDIX family)
MHLVYTGEEAPQSFTKSMFLAGPSPRNHADPNWREEAVKILEELDYEGVVFLPIWRDGPQDTKTHDYDSQVDWENKYLEMADCVVFWVPRDLKVLPAFTTNVEFGLWLNSGKAVLGYPPGAEKMRYLDWQAGQHGVPVLTTLKETLEQAIQNMGWGALRIGGEREVPLFIWEKPEFQSWYKAQTGAGNRLDGCKVVWTFRVGKNKERLFLWALHVDVWIAAEDRHKTNEIVLFRPDISTIVAYTHAEWDEELDNHESLLDTTIAIVKEFRSPAVSEDGYIRELPGGSALKGDKDPLAVAAEELEEETGVVLDPSRFRFVDARQIAGTLSAHYAHVFAVELTAEEMKELEDDSEVHGVEEDTERTYVETYRLGDLLNGDVDWANMGMIMSALLRPPV